MLRSQKSCSDSYLCLSGRGSGPEISADATLVVAIAVRLLLRNVEPDTAFRIGSLFSVI